MRRKLPADLYHGTGILQLAEIVASGYLEVCADDDYDDSGIVGASLTSDRDVAQKFADEAKERDWMGEWNSPVNDAAVLCFDARALEKVVSITPVTWDGTTAEAEFRTHGRVYDPLRFVSKIDADAEAVGWWINELSESGEPELAAALRDERVTLLLGVAPAPQRV